MKTPPESGSSRELAPASRRGVIARPPVPPGFRPRCHRTWRGCCARVLRGCGFSEDPALRARTVCPSADPRPTTDPRGRCPRGQGAAHRGPSNPGDARPLPRGSGARPKRDPGRSAPRAGGGQAGEVPELRGADPSCAMPSLPLGRIRAEMRPDPSRRSHPDLQAARQNLAATKSGLGELKGALRRWRRRSSRSRRRSKESGTPPKISTHCSPRWRRTASEHRRLSGAHPKSCVRPSSAVAESCEARSTAASATFVSVATVARRAATRWVTAGHPEVSYSVLVASGLPQPFTRPLL